MKNSSNDASLSESITVLDWDKEILATNDWNELQKVLSDLPQRVDPPNTIVNVVHPIAGTLSIGIAGMGDNDNPEVGEPLACINYTSASNEPPYLSVVGEPSILPKNSNVIVFRYEQQWTEIPRRNCIAISKMVNVVKYFVINGGLPAWVAWEEI